MALSHFDYAFSRTVLAEGGYVADPDDPGGETRYGITRREYPDEDIAHLTLERARELYWRDHWQPLGLDGIEDRDLAAEIFDTAVHCGLQTAVRICQRALVALSWRRPWLDVAVDGIMGPHTREAVNAAGRNRQLRDALIVTMNSLQVARYVELVERNAALRKFFAGWVLQRGVYALVRDHDVRQADGAGGRQDG